MDASSGGQAVDPGLAKQKKQTTRQPAGVTMDRPVAGAWPVPLAAKTGGSLASPVPSGLVRSRSAPMGFTWPGYERIPASFRRLCTTSLLALSTLPLPIG